MTTGRINQVSTDKYRPLDWRRWTGNAGGCEPEANSRGSPASDWAAHAFPGTPSPKPSLRCGCCRSNQSAREALRRSVCVTLHKNAGFTADTSTSPKSKLAPQKRCKQGRPSAMPRHWYSDRYKGQRVELKSKIPLTRKSHRAISMPPCRRESHTAEVQIAKRPARSRGAAASRKPNLPKRQSWRSGT